jgi:hypothetical protein
MESDGVSADRGEDFVSTGRPLCVGNERGWGFFPPAAPTSHGRQPFHIDNLVHPLLLLLGRRLRGPFQNF